MLTITTEKQTIYINIDLLKSRLKSAVTTILKVLTFLCAFSGVIWIIGTAGQSDLDLITFSEIITKILQGFLFCGVAWVLNFIKLVIE
jgi:hypothetical protein